MEYHLKKNSKLFNLNNFITFFRLFLDEPSTGMDPQSKRFVWNTIQVALCITGAWVKTPRRIC